MINHAEISTFKEFFDEQEAASAVRALHDAGFDDVETYDLSPHLQQTDDVGSPISERKRWVYLVTATLVGLVGGAAVGGALFFIPSSLLQMAYAAEITVIGISVCMLMGVFIGLQEGWILAKRMSYEPTSSNGARSVGVKVRSRDTTRLIGAKNILARFGERPKWLRLHPVKLT